MPKAVAKTSTDAELIELCSDFRATNARFYAVWDEQTGVTDRDSPIWHHLETELTELSDRREAVKEQIVQTPAATTKGLAAKAAACLYELTAGDAYEAQSYFEGWELQKSLSRDVLRLS